MQSPADCIALLSPACQQFLCAIGALSNNGEATMAGAYWVTTYRSISNPAAVAEYAKLAAPAIAAAGGRFLARGNAAKAYEHGLTQRSSSSNSTA
jgi:Domain of unknown function (DUF1330)